MRVSVCTVIFKKRSSHCQTFHPHTHTVILPLMTIAGNGACFSAPKGWKKKENTIPHRLPLKEQSITFQDFMNPPVDASFSRELDMYYSSFLAGNVHTYIFYLGFLLVSLFSSEELLSIAG